MYYFSQFDCVSHVMGFSVAVFPSDSWKQVQTI